MSKIQVLALNDDNHSRCYVTRQKYYADCADFVQDCLLKPHTDEYEVREIYICYPEGALEELSDEEFCELFDLLSCNRQLFSTEAIEKWLAAFDLFWENGSTWNYA